MKPVGRPAPVSKEHRQIPQTVRAGIVLLEPRLPEQNLDKQANASVPAQPEPDVTVLAERTPVTRHPDRALLLSDLLPA